MSKETIDPFQQYSLKSLDVDLIDVGKRARVDYGNLDELAKSLKEVGLIQPLSVVVKAMLSRDDIDAIVEESEEKPYLLLAGGRRFEALKLAGYETVPCKIYTNVLSDEDVFKIELYENIYRKEMTWAEETLLRDKIHRLNLKSKGIIVDEGAVSTAKLKESAAEMGMSIGTLSNDLRIAQAIKDIPELATLKSKAEIRKVLKQAKNSADIKKNLEKLQKELETEEPQTTGGKTVPARLIRYGQSRYILGDFFERAKELPDASFDLVICDPMYGIDFENLSQNNDSMRTGLIKDIPAVEYPAYVDRLLDEVVRLMKPNSWLLMWHAMRWESMYLEKMEERGLKTKDRPIIWVKKPAGNMAPEYQLSSAWEPCLYARKGMPVLDNKQMVGDVLIADAPDKNNRVHPTEKPFRMVGQLIRTFSPAGAKVLVPFAGSGVDLAYCVNDFRDAIGFDIVEGLKSAYDLRIAQNDFQGQPVFHNYHMTNEERGHVNEPGLSVAEEE